MSLYLQIAMIAIFRRKTWREREHLGDLGVDGTCNSKVCIIQLSQINQEMYENVLVRPPGPDDKIDIQRVSFSFTLSTADACHGIRHRKQAFCAIKKKRAASRRFVQLQRFSPPLRCFLAPIIILFAVVFSPSRQTAGQNLNHDCFLPNHCQFTIHH